MNTLQQQKGNTFRRLEDKRRKCRARFRLSVLEFVAKTYYALKGKTRLGAGRILKVQKGWDRRLAMRHTYLFMVSRALEASLSNIKASEATFS